MQSEVKVRKGQTQNCRGNTGKGLIHVSQQASAQHVLACSVKVTKQIEVGVEQMTLAI